MKMYLILLLAFFQVALCQDGGFVFPDIEGIPPDDWLQRIKKYDWKDETTCSGIYIIGYDFQ